MPDFTIEDIERMKDEGKTWREIGEHYKVHKDKVRSWYRRNRIRQEGNSSATFTQHSETSATASYRGGLVYTLDELLKACEVDLDVWEVERYTVNQWQQRTRDGVLAPLYQVKATLKRKKPAFPTISSISPIATPLRRARTHGSAAPIVVITDTHIGFQRDVVSGEMTPLHDRRAITIALEIIRRVRPGAVYILGDLLDFAEFSTHYVTSPDFYWTTQAALLEANYWLGEIRKAARGASVVLLEGNHEKRMIDAIVANMKAAYGLRPVDSMDVPALDIKRLLALDSSGVEYVSGYPTGIYWHGNIAFIHGDVVRKTGSTAAAVLSKRNHTTIFGHIHRVELATASVQTANGRQEYSAFCPGCLCHTDGRVPGSTPLSQWQQGIGVIFPGGRRPEIRSIPIQDGEAVYSGETIKAPCEYTALDNRLLDALRG